MNDLFCGSSCVKFILNKYNKTSKKLNLKMQWISELVISLKENEFNNLILLCYKSNLYNDYKKTKNNNFEGFKYLKNCEKINIPIYEIRLNPRELKKEINESSYIILCVKSSILNHDKNMSGGHFIILHGIINHKVEVVIPRKNKYEYRLERLNKIIKYCKGFGEWRILIREDKNNG